MFIVFNHARKKLNFLLTLITSRKRNKEDIDTIRTLGWWVGKWESKKLFEGDSEHLVEFKMHFRCLEKRSTIRINLLIVSS